MVTYAGSMSEAADECVKAHDRAFASISSEFKEKIKLAESRMEKAEIEYHQIKEKAEKSMAPKKREKYYQTRKKLEKVWLDMDGKNNNSS